MFDFEHSEDEQSQIFDRLRILLAPFLLRRLKKNVVQDLPPKTELILFVGMTSLQSDIYKKLLLKEFDTLSAVNAIADTVDNTNNENDNDNQQSPNTRRSPKKPQAEPKKKALLNLVMQLRKCTNHPYLFEGVEDRTLNPFGNHLIENCGKLALLDKLLSKLKENGSRVLIFSQMTRVLDILEDFCAMKQYKYCRIDGSTSGVDRQDAMDRFNEENSEQFLFLLTTRAGGLGINLQTADIVIIYDSDWNPQCDLQAMDRAHRIGQKKPVTVYRLVTKDTVEERMLERAELKLRLDAMVIQKHCRQKGAKEKKDSLIEMVQYGADKIFKSKGSTVTDTDIDSILAASKSKTDELNAEWEKKSKREFKQFNMEFNYQKFEGEDFSAARKEKAKRLKEERLRLLAAMTDELGVELDPTTGAIAGRGRSTRLQTRIGGQRVNYNEDAYFRARMLEARNLAVANAANSKSNNINKLKVPQSLPDLRYWQLFDGPKLIEMNAKEWEWFNKWKNNHFYDAQKHGQCGLDEKEQMEKEEVLKDGFPTMSYRLYSLFVRCCIKFGRDRVDDIVELMVDAMMDDEEDSDQKQNENDTQNESGDGDDDKVDDEEEDEEEVEDPETESVKRKKFKAMARRYHTAFFERGPEVEGLENAFQRIADGEKRLEVRREREEERERRNEERKRKRAEWEQRKQEVQERKLERLKMAEQRAAEQEEKLKAVLMDRVSKWRESVVDGNDGIWKEIQIPDAKGMDSGFSKEVDRFLFLTTARIGYGEWDAIHRAVTEHQLFRFNFMLKTQSPMQIKQRVDAILRSCGGVKRASKRSASEREFRETTESREQSLVQRMQNVDIAGEGTEEPPAKKVRV